MTIPVSVKCGFSDKEGYLHVLSFDTDVTLGDEDVELLMICTQKLSDNFFPEALIFSINYTIHES